jgi:hypothetical protein
MIPDRRQVEPSQVSNAAAHSLLALLHKVPELSADALDALAGHGEHRTSHAWAAPLATFGLAVRCAAARCAAAVGRMPLDALTVLVCVDGSRLSYLALEVCGRYTTRKANPRGGYIYALQ